jgi:hypothetical protein
MQLSILFIYALSLSLGAFRSLLWRQYLPGVVRIRFGSRNIEFASPWCAGHTRAEYREIAGFRQISQDSISEFPRGE